MRQNGTIIVNAHTAQSVVAGLMRKEVSLQKKVFLKACIETHNQINIQKFTNNHSA